MKCASLALLICIMCGQGYSKTALIFKQILDHNHPDSRTFDQRYWTKTFGQNPPAVGFLMISGEVADANPLEGAWMKYAQQMSQEGVGIVCYELEHRYYGFSKPKDDLEFLSSDQALADVEYFLRSMPASDALKWVVFGGSYAGSLAAWARQKYPGLIHAAVASSAPLEAKAAFPGYDEIVRKSLASVDPDCPRKAHNEVAQCFEETRDLRRAYDLAGIIMSDAQYGHERRACEDGDIRKSGFVPYDAHRNFSMNSTTVSANLVGGLNQTRHYVAGRGFYGDSWEKQICGEFGWFQTSDSNSSLFGNLFPLSFFVNWMCKSDYTTLNAGIKKINDERHGKSFSTERVLFIHGSLDPWSAAGVTSSSLPDMPVHMIEGGSHCLDMLLLDGSTERGREVLKAQKTAMHFLKKWLQL